MLPAMVHAAVLALGLLASAGCTTTEQKGPSRERYVELLRQCRTANREHVRMIREAKPQTYNATEYDLGGL